MPVIDTHAHWCAKDFVALLEAGAEQNGAISSDYNFDAGYPRPVEFVDRIPGLTKPEREAILTTNAMEVLKLKERFREIYEALK